MRYARVIIPKLFDRDPGELAPLRHTSSYTPRGSYDSRRGLDTGAWMGEP